MGLLRSLEDDRVKNLKSLSYGANKPLVTKDINKTPSPQGIGLQASRRVDDLTRIGKFMISPSGLKFAGNQALLQQVGLKDKIRNARKPGGTGVGNALRQGGQILKEVGKTALNTAAIIGSTLAQVPVNGTGTHFFLGFKGRDSFYSNAAPGVTKPSLTNGSENLLQSRAGTTEIAPDTAPPAQITDFRQRYFSDKPKVNDRLYSLDYTGDKIKRETRVNLGDQGRIRLNNGPAKYNQAPEGPEIDKINMLPPIKLKWDNATQKDEDGRAIYDKEVIGTGVGRDLIKFRFEVITPDNSTMLYFRAFLDSFNDNFTGQWSANNYIGRAEAFYTYQGFDRGVSMGFKIAAATRHEMQPLYQKIVFLASSTAPTYGKNFMRGSLVNVTVGDYLYNQPGFIESINYTWNQDYPWEIAMSRPEGLGTDEEMQELPHVLDVQLNFKPIHRFTPQTGLYHYITNPGFGAPKKNLFFSQNNETKPRDSRELVNAPDAAFPAKLLSTEQQQAFDAAAEKERIAKAEAEEQRKARERENISLLTSDPERQKELIEIFGLTADPTRGNLETGG